MSDWYDPRVIAEGLDRHQRNALGGQRYRAMGAHPTMWCELGKWTSTRNRGASYFHPTALGRSVLAILQPGKAGTS